MGMSGYVSPTVRRRRLAAELRRLRALAGLKEEEVAELVGWSPSKVSRYELARTGLRPSDVRKLLEVYRVDSSHQEELLALAREATVKGWWEEYADVVPEDYLALIGLEAEATSELSWHLDLIPGLLQTENYARSVNTHFQNALSATPPSKIERSVQLRLRRQQRLTGEPPLEYSAVLDEAVLRRRVADAAIMREQLVHLVEIARLPSVTLRIMRLADSNPIVINSFDLLTFGTEPVTRMPDVVWGEILQSAIFFEGEADTYQYRFMFGRLAELALGPSRSADLVASIADEVWRLQACSTGMREGCWVSPLVSLSVVAQLL
jgi:transcriptional regulator with XRE-family HTH domain